VEEPLLRFLGGGWILCITLPPLVLGLVIVAKCWSVPGRASPAEYAVGLELLFAALVSQLAALFTVDTWSQHRMVQETFLLHRAMLPVLGWLILGVTIYQRRWGHDVYRQLRVLEGVILPILLGLLALIAVFALNFRLARP
jgi:hypothetical protein